MALMLGKKHEGQNVPQEDSMSVQKRIRNGRTRWVARYRPPGLLADGSRRPEQSGTFDTRKEATAWEEEKKRELRRGEWIDPRTQTDTIEQLVTRWMGLAKRRSTIAARQHLIDNLGKLRHIPIGALRPSDLQAWVISLNARPWAGGTPLAVNTVRGLGGQLSGALGMAERDGLTLRALKVPVPSSEGRHITRAQILSSEDVWMLADLAAAGWKKDVDGEGRVINGSRPSETFARMILTAAGTGLRRSELAGLRVKSVNFLGKQIHVSEQLAHLDNQKWEPLKTPASYRDVPIGELVVGWLAAELKDSPAGKDDAIFRTQSGMAWPGATISGKFSNLRRAAGMPDWVTWHSLRHYAASALIADGATPSGVASILGHSSAAMTLEVYSHLWPGEDERVRDAMDRALRRDSGGTGDLPRRLGGAD